jgi:hypothetical protein
MGEEKLIIEKMNVISIAAMNPFEVFLFIFIPCYQLSFAHRYGFVYIYVLIQGFVAIPEAWDPFCAKISRLCPISDTIAA